MRGGITRPRAGMAAALACLGVVAGVAASNRAPAASAATQPPRVAIQGGKAPGPARYDRVWVRKYGPSDPSCVMVMAPGSPAGQGGFNLIARELANRVSGLGVWTLDRRPNAFEDVSAFQRGTPDQALGYYLGGQSFEGGRFQPVSGAQAPFVRGWGASVTLRDLHRVVEDARDGGRRCVVLAGHSFGALIAPAYASWDFNGRAGFRDLDGLVVIDGGLLGAFKNLLPQDGFPPFGSVAQARKRLDQLQRQTPFGSDASVPAGIPQWLIGVSTELSCKYARADPNGRSALQAAGLGDVFLSHPPSFDVTNAAFAGLYFQQNYGPVGARVGSLARSGSPRAWTDGPRAGIGRLCGTFTTEPGNGLEWYFPIRLEIDLAQGMQQMKPTAITRFLGLRPFHTGQINVPFYAIETRISDGNVLKAAHRLIDRSRIHDYRLVRAEHMKHYDPLISVPKHNRFLKTVVPFLRKIERRNQRPVYSDSARIP
jgi:opacity protein-like surface antigen